MKTNLLKTGTPSIRKNAWDNWYGYIGRTKVESFFNDGEQSQEQAAKEWLKAQCKTAAHPKCPLCIGRGYTTAHLSVCPCIRKPSYRKSL